MAEHLAFKDAVFRPVQKEHFCFFKQAAMRFENGGIGEISNLLSQSIVLEIFRRRKGSATNGQGTMSKVVILPSGGRNFLSARADSPLNVPISITRFDCNSFTRAASNR